MVTPVEKVGITVEDVPFIATDIDIINRGTTTLFKFTTNIGDSTYLEENNQFKILFKETNNEPQPYVKVRTNLFAKIDRKSFYRLIDFCTETTFRGENWLGFHSNNVFFPLIKSQQLY